MEQRRRYKNPPIEEAICEFHFSPGQEWDFTIPGKLHTELSGDYAGKPQEQKVVQVGLETQGGKPPNLRYGEGLAKVKLVTEDGKRMIGVGPDVLSIHILRPYQYTIDGGWDEFYPRIKTAVAAYWKVSEPRAVSRIGIRYINKIVIPQKTVKVEDYLECALPNISGLPDHIGSFMSRVEYNYQDNVQLIILQGSIETPPNTVGFLLDLDVIWQDAEPIKREDALTKVNELREREREAFEAVITDKARDLFDAFD
ncbi:MAG: TIGR04255 family protein [Gammaproteobacteria bacterium]|nr:TIGR04255 family protein [Gammaproteobacteria bacterium]